MPINKKLLEKSIANANFERILRRAIIEEPRYESYMPPIPVLPKVPHNPKFWRTLLTKGVYQLRP